MKQNLDHIARQALYRISLETILKDIWANLTYHISDGTSTGQGGYHPSMHDNHFEKW